MEINGVRFYGVFCLFLIGFATLHGCKSYRHIHHIESDATQKISDTDKSQLVDSILAKSIEFSFLQLKGKAHITFQGKDQQEVTLQVRIQNRKAIWISATAFLGTEVGRILITPQNVQMLNRIDGSYVSMGFLDFLKRLGVSSSDSSVDDAFSILQNLVTANPILLDDRGLGLEVFKSKSIFLLEIERPYFLKQWIKYKDLHLQSVTLSNFENRKFQVFYDWKTVSKAEGISFYYPNMWTANIENDGLKLQTSFRIDKIQAVDDLVFPFNIPGNYKQVDSFQFR